MYSFILVMMSIYAQYNLYIICKQRRRINFELQIMANKI